MTFLREGASWPPVGWARCPRCGCRSIGFVVTRDLSPENNYRTDWWCSEWHQWKTYRRLPNLVFFDDRHEEVLCDVKPAGNPQPGMGWDEWLSEATALIERHRKRGE